VSIVLFYVMFVCKCVLYYCHRVATQLQLNISHHKCARAYKSIYIHAHIIHLKVLLGSITQSKKCDFKMDSLNRFFPLLSLICLSVNNDKSLTSEVNIQSARSAGGVAAYRERWVMVQKCTYIQHWEVPALFTVYCGSLQSVYKI
jgi:hypothetical protein